MFGVLSRSNLLKTHTLLNFASTYSQTPTLSSTKSRRIGPKNITDVDDADDIALLSEDIRTATELFHRVESAAANIGLFTNVGKTKVMTLNLGDQVGDLQSRSGDAI